MSVHYFRSSLISLNTLVQFPVNGTCIYVVRFISKYLILSKDIGNDIVFYFQLLTDCCQHKNIVDFCILIQYPTALLNSLISSMNFFVDSNRFSAKTIMLSVNTVLFLSFQTGCHCLSCFIELARSSSIKVNRHGESRHPFLVADL